MPTPRRPTLLWGTADRFFTIDLARRPCALFPVSRLVEIAGARTFVPLDQPQRIAEEIRAAHTPAI